MRDRPLILLIDDDPAFREVVGIRLTNAGFEVHTADDARIGYNKAKELLPDLVLMDVHMPGTNGTEALLDFKNDPELAAIKIALFTNLTAPWPGVSVSNEKFAKELGAVDFIDKSEEADTIDRRVREILSRTQ